MVLIVTCEMTTERPPRPTTFPGEAVRDDSRHVHGGGEVRRYGCIETERRLKLFTESPAEDCPGASRFRPRRQSFLSRLGYFGANDGITELRAVRSAGGVSRQRELLKLLVHIYRVAEPLSLEVSPLRASVLKRILNYIIHF